MKQKRLIKSRSGHHIELASTSVIGTNLDRLKLTSIAEKASISCAGMELLHAIELSSVSVVALFEISDSKHRNRRSSSVFLREQLVRCLCEVIVFEARSDSLSRRQSWCKTFRVPPRKRSVNKAFISRAQHSAVRRSEAYLKTSRQQTAVAGTCHCEQFRFRSHGR